MYVLAFPFYEFWKFGFLQSFSVEIFNLKIEVSTIVTFVSDLFKINFHASIWHFSNYSTSACSNNHFLLENDFYMAWKSSMTLRFCIAKWAIKKSTFEKNIDSRKNPVIVKSVLRTIFLLNMYFTRYGNPVWLIDLWFIDYE